LLPYLLNEVNYHGVARTSKFSWSIRVKSAQENKTCHPILRLFGPMADNLGKILANRIEHGVGVEMFAHGYLGIGDKICKCFDGVEFLS
jgi:hypothetical protein